MDLLQEWVASLNLTCSIDAGSAEFWGPRTSFTIRQVKNIHLAFRNGVRDKSFCEKKIARSSLVCRRVNRTKYYNDDTERGLRTSLLYFRSTQRTTSDRFRHDLFALENAPVGGPVWHAEYADFMKRLLARTCAERVTLANRHVCARVSGGGAR